MNTHTVVYFEQAPDVYYSTAENSPQQMYQFLPFEWCSRQTTVNSCFGNSLMYVTQEFEMQMEKSAFVLNK